MKCLLFLCFVTGLTATGFDMTGEYSPAPQNQQISNDSLHRAMPPLGPPGLVAQYECDHITALTG